MRRSGHVSWPRCGIQTPRNRGPKRRCRTAPAPAPQNRRIQTPRNRGCRIAPAPEAQNRRIQTPRNRGCRTAPAPEAQNRRLGCWAGSRRGRRLWRKRRLSVLGPAVPPLPGRPARTDAAQGWLLPASRPPPQPQRSVSYDQPPFFRLSGGGPTGTRPTSQGEKGRTEARESKADRWPGREGGPEALAPRRLAILGPAEALSPGRPALELR